MHQVCSKYDPRCENHCFNKVLQGYGKKNCIFFARANGCGATYGSPNLRSPGAKRTRKLSWKKSNGFQKAKRTQQKCLATSSPVPYVLLAFSLCFPCVDFTFSLCFLTFTLLLPYVHLMFTLRFPYVFLTFPLRSPCV